MSERDIFLKNILPLWQQFLTKWYHLLTRIIRPRAFYSYLRAKEIFTLDDEEEVDKTYITTAMKAGNLIDIITRKGEKGFIAFMEVVEYTYPDLFRTLTNITPRQPTEEYKLIARASNTNNLLECLSLLQESLQEKRDTLEELRHNISIMQEVFDAKEKRFNEEVESIKRANEKLREELASLIKIKALYEELMKNVDSDRAQLNELRGRCVSLTFEGLKMTKQESSDKNDRLNHLGKELIKWTEDKKNLESSINYLQNERDKYRKLYEDLQMSLEKERNINKKLEKECKECARNHNNVLDIMAKLEQEIMEQKQEKFVPNHYSQKLRGRTNKPITNEQGSKSERRCAAVFHAIPPLLVYPPKNVRKEVNELLAKKLGKIPEDLIQSNDEVVDLINDLEVLYYEKTDSGYSCIRNSKLKQMETTALLDMSVAFVSHLIKVSIYPIVVVVKPRCQTIPTEEEEYLNAIGFRYHIIDVDASVGDDASKMVKDILPRLNSLIREKCDS